MNPDLRTFLRFLQQEHPDKLARITREVPQEYLIHVIQNKLRKERNEDPVLYFENITGSTMPLISNLTGSYEMLGLSLGVTDKAAILKEYMARDSKPLPVEQVSRGVAPVKEVVWTGKDADLDRLPITHHAVKDSGKYVTMGCMIIRDPDSGVPNVGIYRHEKFGKHQLGAMLNPARHAGYIYRRYQELKQPMEVVIFLGHHPAVIIGASSRGTIEHNELETMGALLGEPLQVVDAETVGLPVPAWAEIAIEGVVQPGNESMDGPFAEYPGYYGSRKVVPVIDVTAITMRKNPIYHDLDCHHQESVLAGVLARETQIYRRVIETIPSVKAVHLPPSGCAFYHVYVSLKKRVPGEGKLAGLAAVSVNPDLKHAIVVEDDVNIYDDSEVLWAIATRFEADEDAAIIPRALGSHLDPTAYNEERFQEGPMTTKVIIDATRPVTKEFAERVVPPQELWAETDLGEYLEPCDGIELP